MIQMPRYRSKTLAELKRLQEKALGESGFSLIEVSV